MAKEIAKPSFTIRVYPEKDRYFFFVCKIFNTRKEMLRYYEANHLDDEAIASQSHKNVQAVTIRHFNYKLTAGGEALREKPERYIGEILFHRRQTGSGTVAHEMTHAAIHLAEYYKLDIFNILDDEEKLAYFIQRMTSGFIRAY